MCTAGLKIVALADGVASGREAVHATRPDVAVVDNRLLDGRGVDLCEALAREVPEIALVIHSAAITAADTDHALALGVRAVVPKTIRASGLLNAIARAADRRAAR